MDLNATLDIIIRDLEETREIIDDLRGYPGVPLLQIELAKSKCRSAGEMIALLKELPANKNKAAIIKTPEKSGVKVPVAGMRVHEPVKESETTYSSESIPEIKEESIPQARTAADSGILADQFTGMPESYNEKLGSLKHDEDITDIIKSKPVSNLAEAIGINDKFLFIREIFNGSLESYNNAINRLETASSLTDARDIVGSYTQEGGESEAVKQLMDLLKRKFPSDE